VEAAAASAGARPEPAALPDSAIKHLGATTNPVQFYFDLLQPAAEQVLLEEDGLWASIYEPLLGDALSAEATVLSTACIDALHSAFDAGSKFTTAEQVTALDTFTARACCSSSVPLFPYFEALLAKPVPQHLEIAWEDLWQCMCETFIALNGKPPVLVAAATEDGEQPPTERDERCLSPLDLTPHTLKPWHSSWHSSCSQADRCLPCRVGHVQGAQRGQAVQARRAPCTMARQGQLVEGQQPSSGGSGRRLPGGEDAVRRPNHPDA